jgi:CubicO group peptidase (beta-lactamase class C family)
MVLRGSRILYENYYNSCDSNSVTDIRSAGKSLTSALMGIAIDQGFIAGVDEKAIEYFPEFDRKTDANWDNRKADITLHHLLSMSFGLAESDHMGRWADPDYFGMHWITDVLNLPISYAPGTRFEYHSAAPSLCGPIIRRSSGMRVPDFAAKYLFEPLGISDYYWSYFHDDHAITQGSFWMRLRDMAKFGQLYLQKGRWDDHQIISEDWIDLSTSHIHLSNPVTNLGYGYYWWREWYTIGQRRIECFYAQGNGGNRIHIFPTEDIVVAIATDAYNRPYMFDQVRMMINRFILSAATSPQGTYESIATIITVPWIGFGICISVLALIVGTRITLFIFRIIRRLLSKPAVSTPRQTIRIRVVRIIAGIGTFVFLFWLWAITREASLEFFMNADYDFIPDVIFLSVNWILVITALLTLFLCVIAWHKGQWSVLDRILFPTSMAAMIYSLGVLYYWGALVLIA